MEVVHGDTDQTPFGLGTDGSRSTPVSGAATAIVARKVRDRARIVASVMLEVDPADLAWERGRWFVRGDPDSGAAIAEIARAAYSNLELPEGVEGQLDASCVYNPPNLTYPFGAYTAGLPVGPDRCERLARAMTVMGATTVAELRACALATLVSDPGQMSTFDRVFAALFGGPSPFPDQVTPAGPAFQRPDADGGPPPATRTQDDPGDWPSGVDIGEAGPSAGNGDEPLAEAPAAAARTGPRCSASRPG